jgi:hypothetical protein
MLNKQLEGKQDSVDAFGFTAFLQLCQKNVSAKKSDQFDWQNKCAVTDVAVLVIVDHMNKMACDLNDRFFYSKEMDFPSWITQTVLEDLTAVAMRYQKEHSEVQNDASIRTLLNTKGTMSRLYEETKTKYPNSASFARKLLLPFPWSYLAECGFSAVNDLLMKKKSSRYYKPWGIEIEIDYITTSNKTSLQQISSSRIT